MKKDAATTSVSHGFRVTAEVLKDPQTGDVVRKRVKEHGAIQEKDFKEIFISFLEGKISENEKLTNDEFAAKAHSFYLDIIEQCLNHFETHNTKEIRGSSLLFLIDHKNQKMELKIIDLASYRELKEGEKDDGYILGLKSLKRLL